MDRLPPPRCKAAVYKRDTYRIRRGYGFRMHYTKDQCARFAKEGDLCRQHARMEKAGHLIERPDWAW